MCKLSRKEALSVLRAHIGGRAVIARMCEKMLWKEAAKLSDAELLALAGPLGTKEEMLLALNKAMPFELCD